MRKGVWDIEHLSKYAKIIDKCVYQGKRYALYRLYRYFDISQHN